VALGRNFNEGPSEGRSEGRIAASTDMVNVSLKITSIHPIIGINSLPAVNHQPEFTRLLPTPSLGYAASTGYTDFAMPGVERIGIGHAQLRQRLHLADRFDYERERRDARREDQPPPARRNLSAAAPLTRPLLSELATATVAVDRPGSSIA
jgi:hypothetical protein